MPILKPASKQTPTTTLVKSAQTSILILLALLTATQVPDLASAAGADECREVFEGKKAGRGPTDPPDDPPIAGAMAQLAPTREMVQFHTSRDGSRTTITTLDASKELGHFEWRTSRAVDRVPGDGISFMTSGDGGNSVVVYSQIDPRRLRASEPRLEIRSLRPTDYGPVIQTLLTQSAARVRSGQAGVSYSNLLTKSANNRFTATLSSTGVLTVVDSVTRQTVTQNIGEPAVSLSVSDAGHIAIMRENGEIKIGVVQVSNLGQARLIFSTPPRQPFRDPLSHRGIQWESSDGSLQIRTLNGQVERMPTR